MTIDAILTPAEIAGLPAAEIADATCVVFDVLRATSSMITALAHGAAEILPVSTLEEAHALHAREPAALLGGERHGERLPGFDLGNSPFEYRDCAGRSIISTTTNGTVALRACAGAARVLAGAILNLGALADELRRAAPARVVLVCAGTFTTFALEDAWAGGKLIELLGQPECTDAALALLGTVRLYPEPLEALRAARNGRALHTAGRAAEVEFCAQLSLYPTVGELRAGRLRRLSGPSEVAPAAPSL